MNINNLIYIFKFSKKYIKPYLKYIVFAFIISVIYSVLILATPIITKQLINIVLIEKHFIYVYSMIKVLIVLILILSISGFFSNFLLVKSYQNISNNIKKIISKKLLNCDIKIFDNNKSGDFTFIIFRDLDIIQKFIFDCIMEMPINILVILILLYLLIKINIILTLIVVFVTVTQTIIIKLFSKKFYKFSLKQKNSNQKVYGFLTEYLSNLFLIKSINFNLDSNNLMKEYDNLRDITVKYNIYSKLIQVIFTILNNAWSIIVLLIGIKLIYANSINLGELIEFTMLTSILYPKVDYIINFIPNFQTVKSSITRVEENHINLLREENNNIKEDITSKDNKILLKNLTLELNKSKKLIVEKELCFSDKSIHIITGENGVGKTTFCSVFNKVNKKYKGEIFIGENNIKDISDNQIKEKINWVVQNSFVLSGTIYENICSFNVYKYSKKYVEKKLKEYNFEKYFKKFPDFLDTMVGENGIYISKGEAQKIAIARILIQNPDIIILDEPTSFLDTKTTTHIKDILIKLKKNSNIILITHDNTFKELADFKYEIRDMNLKLVE